jgi:hypothetical protein
MTEGPSCLSALKPFMSIYSGVGTLANVRHLRSSSQLCTSANTSEAVETGDMDSVNQRYYANVFSALFDVSRIYIKMHYTTPRII